MYDSLITQAYLLQAGYLIALCIAGIFTYRLFRQHRLRSLADDDIIFQCNVTRKGSYELLMASEKVMTIKEAKTIIKRVVGD
ncbi:MAG: hypothetical protein WBA74_18700, partial [Cyclobacteriaceae bacterium]